MARLLNSDIIPEKISPHVFRHSRAMHLLQAGVNLVYIRDILGHVSIQTTEIYARALIVGHRDLDPTKDCPGFPGIASEYKDLQPK